MPDPVVPTEEVVIKETASAEAVPKFESGMTRAINKTINRPSNGVSTTTVETPSGEIKTYDYSFFKDLGDDDYKKYEPIKTKDEGHYYEILQHRNEMKKNQRLLSERDKELGQLRGQKPDERLAKHQEFFDGLKKDFKGTYSRFQKDFDLPDFQYVENQSASGNSIQERLQQFQDIELTPNIEKKFKLEEGTFVYDANEAYKAGTPSYEYRLQTEVKERGLTSEYETNLTKQQTLLTKVKQQTDADMKFLREGYFPDKDYESPQKADEAFVAYLTELDKVQAQINTGEFNPEQNPFALRNIFRGVHHDNLSKTALEKQAKDIHSQYNAKGLYLPDNELPTDPTKLKGNTPPPATGEYKGDGKFSPMHRRIKQSFNKEIL
jgi:hypothetical protein